MTWARTWATPTAGDAKASGSRNSPSSAAHQGVSLTDQVKTGDSGGRRAFPIPTARDSKGSDQPGRQGGPSLPALTTSRPGDPFPTKLNPRFVEWMMGFPPGWTIAGPTACASSATPGSRWWALMLCELSRLERRGASTEPDEEHDAATFAALEDEPEEPQPLEIEP